MAQASLAIDRRLPIAAGTGNSTAFIALPPTRPFSPRRSLLVLALRRRIRTGRICGRGRGRRTTGALPPGAQVHERALVSVGAATRAAEAPAGLARVFVLARGPLVAAAGRVEIGAEPARPGTVAEVVAARHVATAATLVLSARVAARPAPIALKAAFTPVPPATIQAAVVAVAAIPLALTSASAATVPLLAARPVAGPVVL